MFSVAVAVLLVLAAVVHGYYQNYFFVIPDELSDRELAWSRSLAAATDELPAYATERVSVLICAANESLNLKRYLPSVLEQAYHTESGEPVFEVVVVNDRSTDDTQQILRNFQEKYPHLKVVTVPADEPRRFLGKKDALSRGVEAAANDLLLMTDADCRPASPNWIAWMTFPFGKGRDIVGGYGGFEAVPGFLNKFIQCETIHTFAQFEGSCRRGKPYMAVGRNLACRKDLILKAQAHPIWAATASGDDDMLIRICATADNMVVNMHPESHTYSEAKSGFGEYLRQKQRHMSTGKYYRPEIKRLLGGYALSHSLCWIFLICCVVQLLAGTYSFSAVWGWVSIAGIAVIIRYWLFSIYLRDLAEQLSPENERLRAFWPIFDFAWMIYNIVLSPYILWKSRQRWK